MNFAANGGENRNGVALSANDKRGRGVVVLQTATVEMGLWIFAEHLIFARFDDPDDLGGNLTVLRTEEADELTDRVLTLPETIGHDLVDDDDRRSGFDVLVGESSAVQQGNSHGLEITGTDGGVINNKSGVARFRGKRGLSFDPDRLHAGNMTQEFRSNRRA